VCAGLQTWVNFYLLCAAAAEPADGGRLMEMAIEASHGEQIGAWGRATVTLACKTMGAWEPMAQAIAPSRAEAEQDAKVRGTSHRDGASRVCDRSKAERATALHVYATARKQSARRPRRPRRVPLT